jgi:hypothetical protein
MTKARRKALERLFYDLQARCEGIGWGKWDAFLTEIQKGEKGHRGMGRRFTDGRARYAEAVSVAVYYFACKAVLEPVPVPTGWASFEGYRRDYVMGQALRERAEEKAPLTELELRWNELAIDYSADIVGRE